MSTVVVLLRLYHCLVSATVDVVVLGFRRFQGQAAQTTIPEAALLRNRSSDSEAGQARARARLTLAQHRRAAQARGFRLRGRNRSEARRSDGRIG